MIRRRKVRASAPDQVLVVSVDFHGVVADHEGEMVSNRPVVRHGTAREGMHFITGAQRDCRFDTGIQIDNGFAVGSGGADNVGDYQCSS